MAPIVTLVFHYIDRLERNPNDILKYNGGLIRDIELVNPDNYNLSMVEEINLDLGYSSTKGVYWLVPGLGLGLRLGNGLRLLETDNEVANMCAAALDNGNMVHVNLEHSVIPDPIVIEQVVVSDDTHEAVAKNPKGDDEVVDQPGKDQHRASSCVPAIRIQHYLHWSSRAAVTSRRNWLNLDHTWVLGFQIVEFGREIMLLISIRVGKGVLTKL
ncbi:hypothetical protein PIB30_007000, partial [Stylosanthes scabra]|nr:hypothetical protein [Stylosanthes scabra]